MKTLTALLLFATLLGCRGSRSHSPHHDIIVDPPPPPVYRETLAPDPVAHIDEPTQAIPAETLPSIPSPKPMDAAVAEINASLEDVYFAYDRAELSASALAALRHDAQLLNAILAAFPTLTVVVEGHCDERGSAEYNLGLGDQRARRALQILTDQGIPGAAAQVVSYGKEAPQCLDPTEACRQLNRRAHLLVMMRKVSPL